MNSEGNWCCMLCKRDSGIPFTDSPPDEWDIAEFTIEALDDVPVEGESMELLLCKECLSKFEEK